MVRPRSMSMPPDASAPVLMVSRPMRIGSPWPLTMAGKPSAELAAAAPAAWMMRLRVMDIGSSSKVGSGRNVTPARALWLEAQVRLPHAIVVQQLLPRAAHDDAAVLQHVGALGDAQRHRDVLLDQQDGYSALVEHADGMQHFLDDQRRQAERGLVEHDELGRPHQAAADGEHLLLAAGER